MCEPTTIMMGVGLAISALGAGKQMHDTNKAAKVQQEQMQEQATEDTFDKMQEARALRAQARSSSAEAGVSGLSVDALMSDIAFQTGLANARIGKNMSTGIEASAAEAAARNRSTVAQTGSQMLSSVNSWSQTDAGKSSMAKLGIG